MVMMWDQLALYVDNFVSFEQLVQNVIILQHVSAGITLTPSVSHSILKYKPNVKLIYELLNTTLHH